MRYGANCVINITAWWCESHSIEIELCRSTRADGLVLSTVRVPAGTSASASRTPN